jgi:hypothetical protein
MLIIDCALINEAAAHAGVVACTMVGRAHTLRAETVIGIACQMAIGRGHRPQLIPHRRGSGRHAAAAATHRRQPTLYLPSIIFILFNIELTNPPTRTGPAWWVMARSPYV